MNTVMHSMCVHNTNIAFCWSITENTVDGPVYTKGGAQARNRELSQCNERVITLHQYQHGACEYSNTLHVGGRC